MHAMYLKVIKSNKAKPPIVYFTRGGGLGFSSGWGFLHSKKLKKKINKTNIKQTLNVIIFTSEEDNDPKLQFKSWKEWFQRTRMKSFGTGQLDPVSKSYSNRNPLQFKSPVAFCQMAKKNFCFNLFGCYIWQDLSWFNFFFFTKLSALTSICILFLFNEVYHKYK